MAISSITYKIAQEAGTNTADGKKYDNTSRLVFSALSDNPLGDTVQSIKLDGAAPKAGFPHPFIAFMFASRANCRRVSPISYEFDVDYIGRGNAGQSPLDEPPIIEFDFAESEHAFDIDVNGKPIVMVTGEQFDPPIKVPVYDLKFRISRNLSWVDADLMSIYAGQVNSDQFFGLPPGTMRITEPPTANEIITPDLTYFKCKIGFTVRRGRPDLPGFGSYDDSKAWYRRVLAQGFYNLVQVAVPGGNPDIWVTKRANDGNGKNLIKPALHYTTSEGSGVKGTLLPFDPNSGLQDQTQAEWYFWQIFFSLPFSALQVL